MEWLFNLGVKSGFPRYVILVCLIQTCVLFVPESAWAALGIDALSHIQSLPVFVQYYVTNSSFKNAMLVFLLMSPITLFINSALWVNQINFQGYSAFLQRRSSRLERQGKSSGYTLIIGILAAVAFYIWGTCIYMKPPFILGDFVPTKNRFAMFFVHGGAIGLLFPMAIAMLITELRASFTSTE